MEDVYPSAEGTSDGFGVGTPVLDLERYRERIAGQFDSNESADAFLKALWHIMCSFVDLGQDVKSSTENLPFMRELSSEIAARAPDSNNTEQSTRDTPRRKPRRKRSHDNEN